MLSLFFDALCPHRCIACDQICHLDTFCKHCRPLLEASNLNSLFLFQGPWRKAIQQAKFKPDEIRARRLVRFACHQSFPWDAKQFQGITFVPIHWRRRIQRGFDLSGLFASALAKQLKLPVLDLVRSIRFEPPSTLKKNREERILSLKHRFQSRSCHLGPLRLLLVDDVSTTGATLQTVARLLTQDGHAVQTYSLAQTPKK
ncbi:MAG: ComF family protein [Myxococcaceae bacterium]|nr:ComF family protein [Myxococcaceae bacterium]MBH2006458.1 ComF family protein [Myxococcaceae bacterium]